MWRDAHVPSVRLAPERTVARLQSVLDGGAVVATLTSKSPAMHAMLERIVPGRMAAITADVCVPAPIGCGKPATGFRDALSAKEYRISGLCQGCQDAVFGGEEE